jgi:Fic family protein
MLWNWQQPDWPHFSFDTNRLQPMESQFLLKAGELYGIVRHLEENEQTQLFIEIMSDEAVQTSKIEGEIVNRNSVQSSIQRQFGLKANSKHISKAEQGIAEMMVNLYRTWKKPLKDQTLFAWHKMITAGRRNLVDIGCYRTDAEPMQIISGSATRTKIHFEAPPSSQVTKEMARLVDWFNQTAPDGKEPLPALIRSGIAHLYFVSIHPFEDGNGRIGRAIAEKALAQSLNRPNLIALSDQIESKRKDYYAALETTNKKNEITRWLIWFAEAVLQAQENVIKRIEFVIEKARFYDRFKNQLNERQSKVLERMFREGVTGFKGGLSAENYIRITGTSRATATRDLQDLVEKDILSRTGELRHTRYYLNIASQISKLSQL